MRTNDFAEKTLGDVRDAARKKLNLKKDADLLLVQIRNGKAIVLDDGEARSYTRLAHSKLISKILEDDFEAFRSFALSNGSAEVQLTVTGQTGSATKKTPQVANGASEVCRLHMFL